ncbi:MAG: hypothetical protein JNM84_17100 [Planctomycetes bacterium]|nr:hypothetical protein [Planctomycetota bacterium]
MKKSTTAMGLALAAAAALGIVLWASSPSNEAAAGGASQLAPVAPEPVREERTLEVAAAPRETKAPAVAKKKDYVPATDYARPEDVPWEVFSNKKKALTLRPNRILEDGTIEYIDVPMLQKGKRVFGTMTATPTEIAAILPDEVPEEQRETAGAGASAPVGIPTPSGTPPPTPQQRKRN